MPTKPKTNYKGVEHEIQERDQFQTPSYALDPLIPYIKGRFDRIWESACGQGYMARNLRKHGFTVFATDLAMGVNYFNTKPEFYGSHVLQVTNPPFSLKYKWIKHACALGPFALLVPSDVLFAGKYCQPLIKEFGLEMLIPDKRINYKTPKKGWNESSAQMHTSWLTHGLHIGRLVTFVEIHPRPEEEIEQETTTYEVAA